MCDLRKDQLLDVETLDDEEDHIESLDCRPGGGVVVGEAGGSPAGCSGPWGQRPA